MLYRTSFGCNSVAHFYNKKKTSLDVITAISFEGSSVSGAWDPESIRSSVEGLRKEYSLLSRQHVFRVFRVSRKGRTFPETM